MYLSSSHLKEGSLSSLILPASIIELPVGAIPQIIVSVIFYIRVTILLDIAIASAAIDDHFAFLKVKKSDVSSMF